MIWVIPVILMIKMIEKSSPMSYLQLNQTFRKALKWTGWLSLILILYFIIIYFLLERNFHIEIGFNGWLNAVILAGITEEIVFRGFLLRKLMDSFTFWIANTVTSLLFVAIHFPIWMHKGLFEFPNILSTFLTIFALSILFGYVYKKSKSLWSVIIIHALYNLLVLIFI